MNKLFLTIYFSLILVLLISCRNDENKLIKSKPDAKVTLESMSVKVLDQRVVNVEGLIKTKIDSRLTIKLIGSKLPLGATFYGYDFIDDGKDGDVVAGDGVYTSKEVVPITMSGNEILPSEFIAYSSQGNVANARWYLKCTGMSVVQNGDTCSGGLDNGKKCGKSILGGTSWVCICGGTCDWCIGDCDDKPKA